MDRQAWIGLGAVSICHLLAMYLFWLEIGAISTRPAGPSRALGYAYACIGLDALFMAAIVVVSTRWRRRRTKAERLNWLLCSNCLYPLDGESAGGQAAGAALRCPECGLLRTRDQLFADWNPRDRKAYARAYEPSELQ